MKRSDVQGWLLTTLALGVLTVFWVVLPGCVLEKVSQKAPTPPGLVEAVPSRFVAVAQAFNPELQHRTLQWDYFNTTGSALNDRSNVVFEVFKCLDLANPQWIMFGVTTNTYMAFDTTSMMEYYRVKTLNIVTQAESQ